MRFMTNDTVSTLVDKIDRICLLATDPLRSIGKIYRSLNHSGSFCQKREMEDKGRREEGVCAVYIRRRCIVVGKLEDFNELRMGGVP